MQIDVSSGELVDKISILAIKKERMSDVAKIANVTREFEVLLPCLHSIGISEAHPLYQELQSINGELWDVEDALRKKELAQQFDAEFIQLARAVYFTNDKRSRIKRQINDSTGSKFVEEKEYVVYEK